MNQQPEPADDRQHHAGHHAGHAHEDPEDYAARMEALRAALVGRGYVTPEDIDAQIARLERSADPGHGARLVARAWVDPAYRQRLVTDAKAAAAELGVDASGMTQFDVLENTPARHHVVVCTLCSCYPRPILGPPPEWYKSPEYRGRVVREPRAVLAEFGLELAADVEIVVADSTADRRLLVLPGRPAGTEHLSEAELAALVTRDSMIGVGLPRSAA